MFDHFVELFGWILIDFILVFFGFFVIFGQFQKVDLIGVRILEVDPIIFGRHFNGLCKHGTGLVHFIEQVLPLALHQQLLGLVDHVQMNSNHGQMCLWFLLLGFCFTECLCPAQEAHVSQTHLQHGNASFLDAHLRHLLPNDSVVDQSDWLICFVQVAAC